MNKNFNIEKAFINVKLIVKQSLIKANRSLNDVRILAVSKGHDIEKIEKLYSLGHRDFGENYAQELEKKRILLRDKCPDIRWHYIGNIQVNKSSLIAKNFIVHSVSSIKQAYSLAKYRDKKNPLNIFLQINITDDNSKRGFKEDKFLNEAINIDKQKSLKICGIMIISPIYDKFKSKDFFIRVQYFHNYLKTALKNNSLGLSMGISADFQEAVKFNSTIVRIGSSIFGSRKYKNNLRSENV